MKLVYILYHTIIVNYDEDQERVKLIGVYSSRSNAISAIDRISGMPGFKDYPKVLDEYPDEDGVGGFFIDCTELDNTSWSEGFGDA